MKRVLVAAGILLALFTVWYYWTHPLGAKVQINDHVFPMELAVTPKERERGLGYRASLAPDHGMLFLFGVRGKYDFWMRGMQFPLDFLWIADKKIVEITPNVPAPAANEAPVQLTPKYPVDKILELNAGTVAKYGIMVDDEVTFITN